MSSMCFLVRTVLPFLLVINGRRSLPSSQLIMISFISSSYLMLTSWESIPERLRPRISVMRSIGFWCIPTRSPFT
jgi:hypothetical protein